jgi:hypothetical protein
LPGVVAVFSLQTSHAPLLQEISRRCKCRWIECLAEDSNSRYVFHRRYPSIVDTTSCGCCELRVGVPSRDTGHSFVLPSRFTYCSTNNNNPNAASPLMIQKVNTKHDYGHDLYSEDTARQFSANTPSFGYCLESSLQARSALPSSGLVAFR